MHSRAAEESFTEMLTRLLLFLAVGVTLVSPAFALELERVVLVQRHGVRPPTSSNADLARYAAAPWPAWPVPPGELTSHGEATVRLMGESLLAVYRAKGLLPSAGCPAAGEVVVWADGTDQRTRRSGEVLAAALAPGCGVKVGWAPSEPRDPIFGGSDEAACRIDGEKGRAAILRAAGPGGLETPAGRAALARLQTILAPTACDGGAGMCFSGPDTVVAGPKGPKARGPMFTASSLAEDLLLEYAQGMPAADVGWGRAASAAEIAEVMAVHERATDLMRRNRYFTARAGAPMARLVLAALSGEAGPHSGEAVRLLALAGHDTNLSLMAGVFGLDWTLAGEPDATAPATALAFELWSDKGALFVRPVIYWETLEQLRALTPARAASQPLRFADCASGPLGTCPLRTLRRHVEALIPPGCGAGEISSWAGVGPGHP